MMFNPLTPSIELRNPSEIEPVAVLMGSAFSALMTSAFLGGVVSSACLTTSAGFGDSIFVCGAVFLGSGCSVSFEASIKPADNWLQVLSVFASFLIANVEPNILTRLKFGGPSVPLAE